MKQLILFSFLILNSFYISAEGRDCSKAFDQNINPQFIEALTLALSTSKTQINQSALKNHITNFMTQNTSRTEVLNSLKNKEPTVQNALSAYPILDYIISKPAQQTIKFIQEHPNPRQLLRQGALLNMPPFFLMVLMGNTEIINFALKKDPTLALMENTLKEGPLHYAVDAETAKILLNHQANPNKQDKKGHTALHNSREPELAQVLIDHSTTNLNLKNHSGMTALKHHTIFVGNKQIINLLQQAIEKQKAKKFKPIAPKHPTKAEEIKPTRKELAQKRKEDIKAKKSAKTNSRKASNTPAPQKEIESAMDPTYRQTKIEETPIKQENEKQHNIKAEKLQTELDHRTLQYEKQSAHLKSIEQILKDLQKLQKQLQWDIEHLSHNPFLITKKMKQRAQILLSKKQPELKKVERGIKITQKSLDKVRRAINLTLDEIDRIKQELQSHTSTAPDKYTASHL